MKLNIRSSLMLATLAIVGLTSTANAEDVRGYFVGDYSLQGEDTSADKSYTGKVEITKNEGHFLSINIKHDEDSGLGTYYGHISEVDSDTVEIEYKNMGLQTHTATCDYRNDQNNFAEFTCYGSLLGNVGGDGTFKIWKAW